MTAYNFLHREPIYPYHYKPVPEIIRLMAWVHLPKWECPAYVEIIDACGSSRTAKVYTTRTGYFEIPFNAIQSVALTQGHKVLEAFGRPPLADVPIWVPNSRYEEA